jgi:hypothetical protein
MLPWETSVYI